MLRTQNASRLTLMKVVAGNEVIERRLHLVLKEFRHHGEWFQARPFLLEFISSLTDDKQVFMDDVNLLLQKLQSTG